MKTATFSDFRQKMKEQLTKLQEDLDIMILSGPKKKDFVIMPLEMFNSLQETSYLLSTPANSKRLLESIEQDKKGKVRVREVNIESGNSSKKARKSGSGKKAK